RDSSREIPSSSASRGYSFFLRPFLAVTSSRRRSWAWAEDQGRRRFLFRGASRALATEVIIPGPLRSFLRMAGISQKASSDEVLPLLGHNVSSQGFEVSGRPTEYLILLRSE